MQIFEREKMPEMVLLAMGEAQKRLTLLEGHARSFVQDKVAYVRDQKVWHDVDQGLRDFGHKTAERLNPTPLRKKVEDFSGQVSDRAFATVGIATKADIKTITRKINRLKNDLRKITRKQPARKSA